MIDDRTANRNYAKPHETNKMRTEDVPRFRDAFDDIDTDIHDLFQNKQAAATRLSDIVATGITTAMFAANVADTDATLAANSSTRFAVQSAVKSYVDNIVFGVVKWKDAVRAATAAALPANSYSAGVITADANGALAAVDGVTLVVADRVLIKDEVSQLKNGIYVVTAVGDGSNPFILTRATDANVGTEIPSATMMVMEGTTLADTQWTCANNTAPTLGTTAITFVRNGVAPYTGSAGITLTGNDFTLDQSYTPTWTGIHTFGNIINQTSAAPEHRWDETDATTDERLWRETLANGVMSLVMRDDAGANPNPIWSIDRTAHTAAVYKFHAPTTVHMVNGILWRNAADNADRWSAGRGVGSISDDFGIYNHTQTRNVFRIPESAARTDVWFDGPNSGTDGGAALLIRNNATTRVALGNYSAVLSGAYSADGALFTASDLYFHVNGAVMAQMGGANRNLLVTANANSYSLGARYNASGGSVYYGATNSATPDGVFSNNAGSEVFRVLNAGGATAGTYSILAGRFVSSHVSTDSNISAQDYGIYQEDGAWSSPFPDLEISYHTGIKLGANTAYGGIKFYNNSAAQTRTMIFSIGDGDNSPRWLIDTWFRTTDGIGRIHGANNSITYFGSGAGSGVAWYWQNSSSSNVAAITRVGVLEGLGFTSANFTSGSELEADGIFYRYNGQSKITVDDLFYIRDMGGDEYRFVFNTDTGDFTAEGNVTAYSDVRLKTNFEPITNALEKILSLHGLTYDRIDHPGQRYAGLIAQEVFAVLPEVVRFAPPKQGGLYQDIMTLDYGQLSGLWVEGFRATNDNHVALEKRVAELENIIRKKAVN